MYRALSMLLLVTCTATTADAFNWRSRVSFNHEVARQHARITDGRARHSLTRAEAIRLHRDVRLIAASRYVRATKLRLSRESKVIQRDKRS